MSIDFTWDNVAWFIGTFIMVLVILVSVLVIAVFFFGALYEGVKDTTKVMNRWLTEHRLKEDFREFYKRKTSCDWNPDNPLKPETEPCKDCSSSHSSSSLDTQLP